MKNISLALLAMGVASALVAGKMYQKTHTDGHIVMEAAKVVEQAIIYRDSVQRDTVWATEYRTKYVFVQPKRPVPDAYYSDTSSMELPQDLGSVKGTRYVDSVATIALADYIRTPKSFVFKDSNVYLAATVLASGVTIDSLSVEARLSFSPVWKRNVAQIGILTANPYLTGISPLTLYARKTPCVLK
jgi:hypothetical protein